MAVSGLPTACHTHAHHVAHMALDMIDAANNILIRGLPFKVKLNFYFLIDIIYSFIDISSPKGFSELFTEACIACTHCIRYSDIGCYQYQISDTLIARNSRKSFDTFELSIVSIMMSVRSFAFRPDNTIKRIGESSVVRMGVSQTRGRGALRFFVPLSPSPFTMFFCQTTCSLRNTVITSISIVLT